MTVQEVFYYTIIICSWIFLILSLYLFYKIFALINKIEESVNQIKESVNPKSIARSIINLIIKQLKGGE
jgi:uncharacterized membrane protein